MKMIFDLDLDKCVACGACAIACMDQNDIDLKAGETPFRVVFAPEGKNNKIAYVSMACMHCAEAPCVNACPVGCIRKDEETGLTLYDNTNCIGCHSCSLACPFGAPSFGANGKMQKCDGCVTRVACGMLPSCVQHCPTGALRVVTEEDLKDDRIKKSLHRMSETFFAD